MTGLAVVTYLYIGLWVSVLAERLGLKMENPFYKLLAILLWPSLQFVMLIVVMLTNE